MNTSEPAPDTVNDNASFVPITVAIVDDEPEVRRRFELAVRSHSRLSLLFSASTGAQAISLSATRKIDVFLVDLGLPDRDGRDVIRWISAQLPTTLSMVVTVFGDEEHILSSFEAGAVGYLLKDTPSAEIANSIVHLYEGGSPISPTVARSLIRRFSNKHPGAIESEKPVLSDRELEVLRLVEKGLTYDEVAKAMEISWHTVTTYLRRVYRKLQVNSKSQAVFEARQRGIL
jgi:DNA-binding NarL/FixJ family response regulator